MVSVYRQKHQKKAFLLDPREGTHFVLWLDCGHHTGHERAGLVVSRRKCYRCNSVHTVVGIEPVKP